MGDGNTKNSPREEKLNIELWDEKDLTVIFVRTCALGRATYDVSTAQQALDGLDEDIERDRDS